jgi:Barnase-EndoU-ColicinE5/D-RelE like nuclease
MEDEEDLLNALVDLYEKVQVDDQGTDKIYICTISEEEGDRILSACGVNVKGFKCYLTFDYAKHIFVMHGKDFDKKKEQKPVVGSDIERLPSILRNFDGVKFCPKNSAQKKYHDSIELSLVINTLYTLAVEINYNKKELIIRTLYIKNR